MKVILYLLVIYIAIASNISAQELKRNELINTEWFADNADSTFEMFAVNIGVNDSLVLFDRIYTDVRSDSLVFGQQELATIGHHNYANFEFEEKSSLLYYLTSEDNPFHTLVGQMPLWKWKLKGKNKLDLYQDGVRQMTLELVNEEWYTVLVNGMFLETKKMTLVRIK